MSSGGPFRKEDLGSALLVVIPTMIPLMIFVSAGNTPLLTLRTVLSPILVVRFVARDATCAVTDVPLCATLGLAILAQNQEKTRGATVARILGLQNVGIRESDGSVDKCAIGCWLVVVTGARNPATKGTAPHANEKS